MPFPTAMFSRPLPVAVATDINYGYIAYTYDIKTWIRSNVNNATGGGGPIAYDSGSNTFMIRNQSAGTTNNCYTAYGGGVFGATSTQTSVSTSLSRAYAQYGKGLYLSGAFHIHQGNGQIMRYVTGTWEQVRAYTAAAVDIRTLTYDPVNDSYAGSVGGLGIYTKYFKKSPWTLPALGFGTSPNAYAIARGTDGTLAIGGIGGGVGKISTSTDYGQTWTNRTLPAGTGRIASMTYVSDLGLYFYLTLGGAIGTSPDAISWTQQYLSSNLVTPAFIGYSPSLKKVFAVDSALASYDISADGVSWSGGKIRRANYGAFGQINDWGQVTVVR